MPVTGVVVTWLGTVFCTGVPELALEVAFGFAFFGAGARGTDIGAELGDRQTGGGGGGAGSSQADSGALDGGGC